MKTVLVVEDDRDTRLILGEILSEEGYEPVTVEAGDAAIEWLGNHERPCLVLLDLRLPRVSGVAVLEWLGKQEALKKLPVAVLSGLSFEADGDVAPFREQVVAVLHKPFSLDEVIRLLESHCGAPVPGEQQAA